MNHNDSMQVLEHMDSCPTIYCQHCGFRGFLDYDFSTNFDLKINNILLRNA